MKTSSLTKISLITVLALSLAAVITMPLRSTAADNVKGGQRLLELTQPAVTATAPATAPVAMSCPQCKDKIVTYDASSKASVKDLRTAVIHSCPNCSSVIKTVGFGKAKTDKVVHTCSLGDKVASCCN